MTLVDSSVWIGHLRLANRDLSALLDRGQVATHAMVVGELACGQLANRGQFLELLHLLPRIPILPDALVLAAIEQRRWWGRGIGWLDAHLASSALAAGVDLWTLDLKLARLLAA